MDLPNAEPPLADRPVMCAVDASEEGEAVTWAGARIAALTGAPLVLFHAARPLGILHPLDQLLHPSRQARDRDAAMQLLDTYAGEIPVASSVRVASGSPTDETLLAAEEVDAALLVLGSRGGGVRATLLGSVPRALIARTTRPVLVVPGYTHAALFHGPVVCGISDVPESVDAARVAAELAAALGAELILVGIVDLSPVLAMPPSAAVGMLLDGYPTDEDAEGRCRERVESVAAELRDVASVRVVLDQGDPATRLALIADEYDASMLALGSPHQSAVGGALVQSVSTSLLGSASRLLLLVPSFEAPSSG